MTRLKNYITEYEDFGDGTPHILALIQRDCKPFLKEMAGSGHFIYRGHRNNITDYDRVRARLDNRIPKDTPEEVHEAMNREFEQRFGWPARNGVFCSGDKREAGTYGVGAYLFFPIGQYEYVWSRDVQDFFANFVDSGELTTEEGLMERFEDDKSNRMEELVYWSIDGNEVDEVDIEPEHRDEIMDELYNSNRNEASIDIDDGEHTVTATLINFEYWKENYAGDTTYPEDVVRLYTDNHLKNAVDLHVEISFKCNEYYLVEMIHEKALEHLMK